MSYGTALFLIAVGALLRYAVNASPSGFNVNTAGTILMIVGAVGLVLTLLLSAMWTRRRETVERPVVRERHDAW
ncbi:MAG: DUF6458 family protein [Solirubrobacteraceae bacterium]|nr:DUF6458 family protein [Solirubrobacteraceae bacterium]